jgi:hypothetical protein
MGKTKPNTSECETRITKALNGLKHGSSNHSTERQSSAIFLGQRCPIVWMEPPTHANARQRMPTYADSCRDTTWVAAPHSHTRKGARTMDHSNSTLLNAQKRSDFKKSRWNLCVILISTAPKWAHFWYKTASSFTTTNYMVFKSSWYNRRLWSASFWYQKVGGSLRNFDAVGEFARVFQFRVSLNAVICVGGVRFGGLSGLGVSHITGPWQKCWLKVLFTA